MSEKGSDFEHTQCLTKLLRSLYSSRKSFALCNNSTVTRTLYWEEKCKISVKHRAVAEQSGSFVLYTYMYSSIYAILLLCAGSQRAAQGAEYNLPVCHKDIYRDAQHSHIRIHTLQTILELPVKPV